MSEALVLGTVRQAIETAVIIAMPIGLLICIVMDW